jgi:hypothetical protein
MKIHLDQSSVVVVCDLKDGSKIRQIGMTLHFCHVQSRSLPPTLCFSCHPPAAKISS